MSGVYLTGVVESKKRKGFSTLGVKRACVQDFLSVMVNQPRSQPERRVNPWSIDRGGMTDFMEASNSGPCPLFEASHAELTPALSRGRVPVPRTTMFLRCALVPRQFLAQAAEGDRRDAQIGRDGGMRHLVLQPRMLLSENQ